MSKNIDSIELLRVLLLLFESPNRVWTVTEITRELCSSNSSIEKRLNDLYARNILSRNENNSDVHGFTLYSDEVRSTIKEISEFNKTYPYLIIELIYSRHNEVLNAFAEAFKFKKEK